MKAGVPQTLAEVAELVRCGEPMGTTLGNFLAFLRPDDLAQAVEAAPVLFGAQLRNGEFMDVYLAAVAEPLSNRAGIVAPAWTENPEWYHGAVPWPKGPSFLELLWRNPGAVPTSGLSDLRQPSA